MMTERGTGRLSLVVVAFGGHDLVTRLLDSLRGHPDRTLISDVVLVDNGWPERGDARQLVRSDDLPFPIRFVQNPARSYASGVNRGAAVAAGDIIVAANSDLEWRADGTIRPLIEAFDRHPSLGVASPQLLFPDLTPQQSEGPLPSIPEALASLLYLESIGRRLHHARPRSIEREVDWVAGAFLASRRACFDALEGFDESYEFYGEDVDFCWRATRAGWRSMVIPAATLIHIKGASSRVRAPLEYLKRLASARRRFVTRRSGALAGRVYGWLQQLNAAERLALAWVARRSRDRLEEHRDWVVATREAARG